MRLLGILLVIFGVVLLIYGGLTIFIPRETWDIGVGALTIRVHETMAIPLPPILGLASLIAGIIIIMSTPTVIVPPRE